MPKALKKHGLKESPLMRAFKKHGKGVRGKLEKVDLERVKLEKVDFLKWVEFLITP